MIDANESKNTEDGDDAEFDYISHFKCLKIQSNPDGAPSEMYAMWPTQASFIFAFRRDKGK
jgi:hypothetical protein